MVQDLRVSRGLRQEDVAARAGVSRETISRVERGRADGMTVGTLRAISRALGMPSMVTLGWRSPEIDRIRDRLHAAMVEEVVSLLGPLGWDTKPEHSFSHYGERGSVDVLAWHAASDALLVVEAKTRLWDIQDLLSTMDRKRRLLPGLVAREFGWKARWVGAVLRAARVEHPSTCRRAAFRHVRGRSPGQAAGGASLAGRTDSGPPRHLVLAYFTSARHRAKVAAQESASQARNERSGPEIGPYTTESRPDGHSCVGIRTDLTGFGRRDGTGRCALLPNVALV